MTTSDAKTTGGAKLRNPHEELLVARQGATVLDDKKNVKALGERAKRMPGAMLCG